MGNEQMNEQIDDQMWMNERTDGHENAHQKTALRGMDTKRDDRDTATDTNGGACHQGPTGCKCVRLWVYFQGKGYRIQNDNWGQEATEDRETEADRESKARKGTSQ